MRIVLDTNVLLSGLIRPAGTPARVVDLVVGGDVRVALDHRIYAEYHEVLMRPEFSLPPDRVSHLLDFLWRSGDQVQAAALSLRLPDPSDVMFVEVAVAGRADALVTGNARHFPPDRCRGVRILSPRAFLQSWARHRG